MLYESAARADEVLCLNVEDLYPQDKRGRITAKGGATEWIHWQSGTAQILPRLIARRTRGPLLLTDRKAPTGTSTLDVCPETGRARFSYRLAEEIFEENTRLLANPLASADDIEDLDGWTVHRLRHSALTHDAEDGTSPRCCWPAPATSPSAPWSDTPAPASMRSLGTSPSATLPHVAGRDTHVGWCRRSCLPPSIVCLDSTHPGQTTELVDLQQPGKKEIHQGCRECPGSQDDSSGPRPLSQAGAHTRCGPARPSSRARGAQQLRVGAAQTSDVRRRSGPLQAVH
ncbi:MULTISPECIES: site-specific integrase [unclassified Streptomyces]|uniref:site-specific integrase n=1 Tax=unclassified Streptomyces TaxID=2593676 RepID=UPI0035A83B10